MGRILGRVSPSGAVMETVSDRDGPPSSTMITWCCSAWAFRAFSTATFFGQGKTGVVPSPVHPGIPVGIPVMVSS